MAPGELILPYIGEVHIGTPPFGRVLVESSDGSRTGKATAVDTPDIATTANLACDTSTNPREHPDDDLPQPNTPNHENSHESDINPDKDKYNNEDNKHSDNSNVEGQDADNKDDPYDYATSDYDLWLDREADLAVDAARAGNEARFINDYRGVPGPDQHQHANSNNPNFKTKKQKKDDHKTKAKANAEFKTVWDPRTGERGMAVFVLPAGKKATGRARVVGIARGEEVLVSYGRGFWQGRREGEEEWSLE